DIRLVGTNSTFEGRIEIMYQGAWGTVCDDGFDLNDATVACRHLKLGKALSFKGAAAYGAGNGKIVMDDLQCKNTEKSLFECKQHPAGVGHSNCGHAEDVGVRCSGPDMSKKCSVADLLPTRPAVPTVRLVGGRNKQEGRVEILHEGVWGTVCDDDWDVKDASVVCRELGFGKALRATKHAEFGKGSEGMIWADNVDCYGYESSLSQCRNHGWGVNNCDLGHGEDAGVVC
ncbi:predicted protein, partial [Nematostella vectensis]